MFVSRNRLLKKVFILGLLSLSFLYILPFVYLVLHREDIGYLVTKVVAEKSIENCETDSSKAIKLLRFMSDNFNKVKGAAPEDGSPYELLLNETAICDQQAHVFICLARRSGINARMTFLYGNSRISHHTVAEIEINGKYRMFGVYFNKLFLNKQNCLATITDIQNGNIRKGNMKFLKEFNLSEHNYFHLFDKKYPPKIFIDNKVNYTNEEKVNHSIIDVWYTVFGDIGLKPYLACYFKNDQVSGKKQKRINELVY